MQDRYLVDFTRGEVYELNPIGYELVKSLYAGKELEEIIKQISQMYQMPEEKVEADVQKFLKLLENEKVVEVVEYASEDISGN